MEVDFGNPSSAHGAGRRARQALEDARDQVAALAGADRSHVIFTSGGTEANNLLFRNLASSGVRRVITTAVEHSSILGLLDAVAETGIEVRVLPVDSNGCIRLDELQRVGVDRQTFVSIQWANNETGVLQPVMEMANSTSTSTLRPSMP
jgi:cysteine desulfurase